MKPSSSKNNIDVANASENIDENGDDSPITKMQKKLKEPALAEIVTKLKQIDRDHKEINDINK